MSFDKNRIWYLIGSVTLIAAIVMSAGILSSCGGPMINDVTTGETPEYPDLQPQRFEAEYDRVFDVARDAAASIGVAITSADRDAGEIRGVATTRVFRFKDDVTITLTRDGNATIVNIRSASRVGKSDLGKNAKRIRKLQAALAERL